jgi:hypothetical protein
VLVPEAVESRVPVTSAEAALDRGNLSSVLVGPGVRAIEQALAETGQGEPNDWDDPDLVFVCAGARVAHSTDPFVHAEPRVLVYATGPM